ncbi:CMRF35-like molecule 5 [Alosa sapidissima]|uniref:CMRF35-like molecule 5 n=1 Tax=Alosa sapidissima TaxID=34773 RepID=UPI001C0965AC|nr:CMRF35-like molecule 5 [Alosa sapidissima]
MAHPIPFILILILKGVFTAPLSAPQEICVVEGGSAVISCHYHTFYLAYVKYWCKGYYWNHCTVLVKTNEAKNKKEKIQISDDQHSRTFNITMKNVKMEDGGWYWCAIERVSKHVKVGVLVTIIAGTPYQSPKTSKTTPIPPQVKVTTSSVLSTTLCLPSTTNEQTQTLSSPINLSRTTESTTYKPPDLVWGVWSIGRWILFFGLTLYLFGFMAYHHFRKKRRKMPSSHMTPDMSSDGFSSGLVTSHHQPSVAHSLAENSLYCRYRDRRRSLE